MILGVLAFVGGVLLSISLHELGHLLAARRFGMVVTEFAVGLGPRLVSWRQGGTRFSLRLLPAGGYVRIEGSTPETTLPEGMDPRLSFWRFSALKRVAVMAAGSGVHLVLAFLLLVATLSGTGLPRATSTVEEVPRCLDAACLQESPARAAGVLPGDELVTINGTPVRSWVQDSAREVGSGPVVLGIERNGSPLELTVIPALSDGRSRLGLSTVVVQERSGLESLPRAALEVGRLSLLSLEGVVELPGDVISTASNMLRGDGRDPSGPVGLVGAAVISGDVSNAGLPSAAVWAALLSLLAAVNAFLAVFNLLPIPPLDGGSIAVTLFEQARHKLRQLRGYRGELERVEGAQVGAATVLALFFFVSLSAVVLVADVLDPVRLF